MNNKSEIGRLGEDLACQYLISKGYKIVERNHRQKWGEIDIVCCKTTDEVVLVEVKTVSGDNPMISAEMQMTDSKIIKFKRAAEHYVNQWLDYHPYCFFRLDVLALNINGKKCRIRHYKNI